MNILSSGSMGQSIRIYGAVQPCVHRWCRSDCAAHVSRAGGTSGWDGSSSPMGVQQGGLDLVDRLIAVRPLEQARRGMALNYV